MKDSPCRTCDDREVGCHASCAAYLAWAEEQKNINRRETADRAAARAVTDSHRRAVKKALKGETRRKEKK